MNRHFRRAQEAIARKRASGMKSMDHVGVYFEINRDCFFELRFAQPNSCLPEGFFFPLHKGTTRQFAGELVHTAQKILDEAVELGSTLSEVLDVEMEQCKQYGYDYARQNKLGVPRVYTGAEYDEHIKWLSVLPFNVIHLETFGLIKTDNHNGMVYCFQDTPFRAPLIKWNGAV